MNLFVVNLNFTKMILIGSRRVIDSLFCDLNVRIRECYKLENILTIYRLIRNKLPWEDSDLIVQIIIVPELDVINGYVLSPISNLNDKVKITFSGWDIESIKIINDKKEITSYDPNDFRDNSIEDEVKRELALKFDEFYNSYIKKPTIEITRERSSKSDLFLVILLISLLVILFL